MSIASAIGRPRKGSLSIPPLQLQNCKIAHPCGFILTFPKISRQFLVNFPKFIDIRPKKIDIILKLVDNHPKFIGTGLYCTLCSVGGS